MRDVKGFTGLFVISACLLSAWTSQALASTAGVFQFVAGDVRIALAGGNERPAAKGSPISVGDTVTTAKASTAQIKMGDGAIIVVQPESKLTVAEFNYTGKEDGTERVQFRLEQGGFRSVTGAIGHTHKGNYMLETPIAHIGVRGTDHESWYFPSGVSADGAPAEAGLYNKVNAGLTYIQTGSGEVVIGPNQVGYAATALDRPHLLDAMPEFFKRSFQPRSARVGGPQGAGVPVAAKGGAKDKTLGVNWGTWQGGVARVNGRATSGSTQFTQISNLTSQAQNLTSPAQLAVLPPQVVNATYNYVSGSGGVSGTASPTGTINALSVSANLTAQTITNYSVNATVGAQNWNASGSGSFAQYSGSGISIDGKCSGCVPGAGSPTAHGTATGAFVGGQTATMTTSFGMKAASQSISGTGLLSR